MTGLDHRLLLELLDRKLPEGARAYSVPQRGAAYSYIRVFLDGTSVGIHAAFDGTSVGTIEGDRRWYRGPSSMSAPQGPFTGRNWRDRLADVVVADVIAAIAAQQEAADATP